MVNFMWQAAPWLVCGGTKKWKSILDPMNGMTWTAAFAGHMNKSLQWGLALNGSSETLEKTTVSDATFYFNNVAGDNTIGSQMKYSVVDKKFDCKVGLAMKKGDHTWKFRLHESGLARAALQW